MHTAEELFAAVEASPAAVAAHDRTAWVNLYAREGEVNDPVGSRPHRGEQAIERFYDTFIAPNTIRFHVEHDIAKGMTVVRDLTLETVMSTGATLSVPMHLRYDLVEEDGLLKIARLAAHWELAPMIGQLLRAGVPGLTASAKLTPQLIGNQGLGGAIGFLGGLRSVGRRGRTLAVDALAERLQHATVRKPIVAGRTVSATVEFENNPAEFENDRGESTNDRGVAFVEFAPRSLDITSISVLKNER